MTQLSLACWEVFHLMGSQYGVWTMQGRAKEGIHCSQPLLSVQPSLVVGNTKFSTSLPDSGSSQMDGEARHRSSWNHTQMRHKHVDQNFRDSVQKVFCSGWPILKALHKWRTEHALQWCLELWRKEALSPGQGYSSCFPCQDLLLLYWDWN